MGRYSLRNGRDPNAEHSSNGIANGVHVKSELVDTLDVSDTGSEQNHRSGSHEVPQTLTMNLDEATVDSNTLFKVVVSLHEKVDAIMNAMNLSTITSTSFMSANDETEPLTVCPTALIEPFADDPLAAIGAKVELTSLTLPSPPPHPQPTSTKSQLKKLGSFPVPLASPAVFWELERALGHNTKNIRAQLLAFFQNFASCPKNKQIRIILSRLLGDSLMLEFTYSSKRIRRESANFSKDNPYKDTFSDTNFNLLLKEFVCDQTFTGRQYDKYTGSFVAGSKSRLQYNKKLKK